MSQRITGHTELIALIATPIRHSKSPMMHNTAFEALGLDYVYLVFEVGQEQLENTVNGLKAMGVRGYNVSMPNKTVIHKYLDEISPAAKMCGSVNTVVNDNGRLIGYVTDGIGYMQSLREENVDIIGKKITVLGVGGAANAICVQAALDGVKEIAIFNRKDSYWERGVHMVELINNQTHCKATLYPLEDREQLRREIETSVVLTNATNVGMGALQGQCLIPDESYLRPELVVTDVIYMPETTALLEMAGKVGCHCFNGLGMMLYQGAAAFQLWTGKDMPIDAVKKSLHL